MYRFWIEFEGDPFELTPLTQGCGVTGIDLDDALALIRHDVLRGSPLPPIRKIVKDVDISTLDANHVLPNIGVPISRGVWYPRIA